MNKGIARFAVLIGLLAMVGCAPTMSVQRMEPIRLPHTYSVMLLTYQKPTKVQWDLLAKMEETLNYEQMLNVVYLPEVEYFDGSDKTLRLIANSGADTVIVFKKLQLTQTRQGYRLDAVMDFLKPVGLHEERSPSPGTEEEVGFILKGERESSVELHEKVSQSQAIDFMATRMTLEVSQEITPAEDAQNAPYMAPSGGPAGLGDDGQL